MTVARKTPDPLHCPDCDGRGSIQPYGYETGYPFGPSYPCDRCGGSGVRYCTVCLDEPATRDGHEGPMCEACLRDEVDNLVDGLEVAEGGSVTAKAPFNPDEIRHLRAARAALTNPIDRIAFDNQWVGGVPIGLLLMCGQKGDR